MLLLFTSPLRGLHGLSIGLDTVFRYIILHTGGWLLAINIIHCDLAIDINHCDLCLFQWCQFKERDMLEAIFKFWRGSSPFDIAKCWLVLKDSSVVLLSSKCLTECTRNIPPKMLFLRNVLTFHYTVFNAYSLDMSVFIDFTTFCSREIGQFTIIVNSG